MTKYMIVLTLAAFCMLGCSEEEEFLGGTARLTVVNNTSRYVDGTIDADKKYGYDVEAGTEETYSLPVGEGVLNYTNVLITARIHETADPSSPVVASDDEHIRMSEGKSYEYVIPFSGSPGSGRARETDTRPTSSVTRP